MWQNYVLLAAQSVPEGRVFGLDFQTLTDIGIQLLNGIILAAVLTALLYNPVKEFLQERSERIQGQIDDSEETMEEAQSLISEYDNKIESIEEERVSVLEDARKQAEKEGHRIKKEAESEADRSIQRAKEGIEADRKRLQDESRTYIIEAATLISEKYVAENMDQEDQEQAFDRALSELEESTWRN
jgi:F-type H+-transporting ATPase subunit b